MFNRIPCALALLLGVTLAQAQQHTSSTQVPTPKPITDSEPARVEPVVLSRSSLDEKVVTLRVAPRIATSIRLPEPVNSVVVGDPENFQAEHSEREPELVTVKPITDHPAQTNLLITTTLGHQINLLLLSPGEPKAGSQAVDVLLTYGKPKSGMPRLKSSVYRPDRLSPRTELKG
jgi:hypothetical protein